MEREEEMVRCRDPRHQDCSDSASVPFYYYNSYESLEVPYGPPRSYGPPEEKDVEAKEAAGTTARSSQDSQVTFADLREADKPAEDEPMNVEADSSDGDSTETVVTEHGAFLRDLDSYVVLLFFDLVNHLPPSTMIAEEPFTTEEIAREAEKRVGPIPVQFFTNNRRPLHIEDLLAHRVVLWVYRIPLLGRDVAGCLSRARGASFKSPPKSK